MIDRSNWGYYQKESREIKKVIMGSQFGKKQEPEFELLSDEQEDKVLDDVVKKPMRYLDLVQKAYDDFVELHGEWNSTGISDICSDNVNHVVTVKGQVQNRSKRKEYKHRVNFRCKSCMDCFKEVRQELVGDDLDEPRNCTTDGCSGSWEVIDETSKSEMRREIMLQQLHSESNNPDNIRCVLDADFANRVEAGDRIRMNAVVVREDKESAYSDLVLYCCGIEKEDELDLEVSQEDKEKFEETAENHDMLEYMRDSVAPNLVGEDYDGIREGVLLQLMSGDFDSNFRSESNIMIAGDAGTGKSEFLSWASEVSKVGTYTGENSTGVGLVGTVEQVDDFDSSEWSVRAGTIPRASGGVCAIDELDKLSSQDISKLHTALSQDNISLNKASKSVSLNAETSILAAANPKDGSIKPSVPILEQLDFPSTIISRFDLVFILEDSSRGKEEVTDIISQRRQLEGEDNEYIEKEWITKYVEYAKENYSPSMTDDADEALKEAFCDLGDDDLNPRYLDALERLGRSHARLQLREKVTSEDIEVAYELLQESFRQLGLDNGSSDIDFQKIETGISEKEQEVLELAEGAESYSDFVGSLEAKIGDVNGTLERLEDEGRLFIDEEEDLVRRI